VSLPRRPVLDVSELPTTVFGTRDMMWWGTLGFIIVEGFTLVLCATVYVYLRKNFSTWPPENVPRPAILVPTVHVALMALSLVLATRLGQAAIGFHFERVRMHLSILSAFSASFLGLRFWELTRSLNVRWDANAYGSAQWLVVGAHATLLAIQFLELAGMTAIFWRGPIEKKHFADASDLAFYWWFIVLSWVPLYVLCFLLPWWI
jgi:heme/copper-type cytochrome/quinol oxidase subunit 3